MVPRAKTKEEPTLLYSHMSNVTVVARSGSNRVGVENTPELAKNVVTRRFFARAIAPN